jgi:hypothetical protein
MPGAAGQLLCMQQWLHSQGRPRSSDDDQGECQVHVRHQPGHRHQQDPAVNDQELTWRAVEDAGQQDIPACVHIEPGDQNRQAGEYKQCRKSMQAGRHHTRQMQSQMQRSPQHTGDQTFGEGRIPFKQFGQDITTPTQLFGNCEDKEHDSQKGERGRSAWTQLNGGDLPQP